MRANAFVLGSVAILSLGLSACGTIMDGGSQTVDVVVKGSPSAFCEFSTSVFKNAATFPNKMIVERSRENLVAECRGEQNKYIKFEIPSVLTASGTVGNVATGVVPGVAYDAASGGMWAYPDPIIVDFRKNYAKADTKPAWPGETVDDQVDATRIGTANIVAPTPVRMQPILDEQLNPALPATHAPMAKKEVIDAVRLATDKQPAAVKVETTTTTATATPTKITPMKPIVSPEDDPAVQKAKAEAKAKAAAEAKKKAAAKKKAEEEAKAKKAADEAAAKAEADAKAAADAAAASAAQAAPVVEPAPGATTTTTTTTTTTEPAPTGLTTPSTTPDASTTTTTTTTTTEPAPTEPAPPKEGESVDQIEYLKD
ncbi:MAG TPA: hypothetical protein VIN59_02405 [Alphaproteobacteria bacterium]